jgi:hypothetical protein
MAGGHRGLLVYSVGMTAWQYAQLRVTYGYRSAEDCGRWAIAWHGPVATTRDTAGAYEGVVAELNRAGTEGWELFDVATLDAGDGGRFSDQWDWSLTRYTFRRPYASASVKSTEPVQRAESPRWQPIGTSQPADSHGGGLAGLGSAESATLVRFTVFCKPDSGSGSDAGRLQIRCEIAPMWSQAAISEIERRRSEYQDRGTSNDRREEIKAAAADYAASWTEGQFHVKWFETSQSFPLTKAAELLHGSADWLHQLVEDPMAGAASWAGIPGPLVPIGAGITANLVTTRLTAPIEGAALMFEAAGIVVGLATGAYPLVMASAKLYVHDKLGEAISKGFEQIFNSIGAGPEPTALAAGTEGHKTRRGRNIALLLGKPQPQHTDSFIRKNPPDPGSVRGQSSKSADQSHPPPHPEPPKPRPLPRPYEDPPPRPQPPQPGSPGKEGPGKGTDTNPGIPGRSR